MFKFLFNRNFVYEVGTSPEGNVEGAKADTLKPGEKLEKAKLDLKYAEDQLNKIVKATEGMSVVNEPQVAVSEFGKLDQDLRQDVQELVATVNALRSFIQKKEAQQAQTIDNTFTALDRLESNFRSKQKTPTAEGDPMAGFAENRYELANRQAYTPKEEKAPAAAPVVEKPEEKTKRVQGSLLYKFTEWMPNTIDEKMPALTAEEVTEIRRLAKLPQPTTIEGKSAIVDISADGKVARLQIETRRVPDPVAVGGTKIVYGITIAALETGAAVDNVKFATLVESEKETKQRETRQSELLGLVDKFYLNEVEAGSYLFIESHKTMVDGVEHVISQALRKDIDGYTLVMLDMKPGDKEPKVTEGKRFDKNEQSLKDLQALVGATELSIVRPAQEGVKEFREKQTAERMAKLLEMIDGFRVMNKPGEESEGYKNAIVALNDFVAVQKPDGIFTYNSQSGGQLAYLPEDRKLVMTGQGGTRMELASLPYDKEKKAA